MAAVSIDLQAREPGRIWLPLLIAAKQAAWAALCLLFNNDTAQKNH